MLYLTVLSFGGQMVTYLLSTGFIALEISFLRVASVLAELGGTIMAPYLMNHIGTVRAGLWFLLWQVTCVGMFSWAILTFDITSKLVGICLAVSITFKRLGLWGSDLAIQYIVQEVSALYHDRLYLKRRQ